MGEAILMDDSVHIINESILETEGTSCMQDYGCIIDCINRIIMEQQLINRLHFCMH